MGIQINLFNPAAQYLSTVWSATGAEYNNKLNSITSASFTLPMSSLGGILFDHIEPGNIAEMWRIYPDNHLGAVGAMIITAIDMHVTEKGTVMTVRGNSMEQLLLGRLIGFATYQGDNIIQTLLNIVGGWSAVGSIPSNPCTIVGQNQTVYKALLEVAEQSGDTFTAFTDTIGTNILAWYNHGEPLGGLPVVLDMPDGPTHFSTTQPRNEHCLTLHEEWENKRPATRLHVHGARTGEASVTLAPAQGVVAVPPGFSVSWEDGIITSTHRETTLNLPRYDIAHDFTHIAAATNDAKGLEDAAVSLFWAGVNYLKRETGDARHYKAITTWHKPTRPRPGAAVHLFYQEYIDGRMLVRDINRTDLMSTETTYSMNSIGDWQASWTLAALTKPALPDNDNKFLITCLTALDTERRRLG